MAASVALRWTCLLADECFALESVVCQVLEERVLQGAVELAGGGTVLLAHGNWSFWGEAELKLVPDQWQTLAQDGGG